MTLPTIVWGVDDVLNNLTFEWFEEFKVNACSGLAYVQLSENPPDKILGISLLLKQIGKVDFFIDDNEFRGC
jgi:hypothetical protein